MLCVSAVHLFPAKRGGLIWPTLQISCLKPLIPAFPRCPWAPARDTQSKSCQCNVFVGNSPRQVWEREFWDGILRIPYVGLVQALNKLATATKGNEEEFRAPKAWMSACQEFPLAKWPSRRRPSIMQIVCLLKFKLFMLPFPIAQELDH